MYEQSDAQTCGQTLLQLVLASQLHLLRACPLIPEACQQSVQTLGRDLAAGTPVQNNMRELYGLMNLLDDDKYSDEEEFFDKFGGDKEAIKLEQVQALQVCPRILLNIMIFLLLFHSMFHHKTIYYTIFHTVLYGTVFCETLNSKYVTMGHLLVFPLLFKMLTYALPGLAYPALQHE